MQHSIECAVQRINYQKPQYNSVGDTRVDGRMKQQKNHRKFSCGNESGFSEFRWNIVTCFCERDTEI
jgi:hypothetical protein